jgi:hypothetical protein
MDANLEEAQRLRAESARLERGDFAIKTPAYLYEDDVSAELISEADIDADTFLCPVVDAQLSRGGSSLTGYSIMEEIEEDMLNGKLRPFVEGEPIGVIKNWLREPAPMLKNEAELYNERQKELNELRAKNNASLRR